MKKTIQTILLLISINICVAQNYKGIAIYKKEVSYLSDDDEFIKKHRDKNYEYYINVQKMDNNVKDIISMINFKLSKKKELINSCDHHTKHVNTKNRTLLEDDICTSIHYYNTI